MAIRDVLRMGHPVLLQRAAPVDEFGTEALRRLVEDLRDTMAAKNGAGIAAPQIGVSQRVVIFGVQGNPRYPDAESVPETVLINPVIEPLGDDMEEGWEGCLSVPGLRGLVPRFKRIRYRGFDVDGNVVERTAADFHARVVQHECDHLEGILYPRRMNDMRTLGFIEELVEAGLLPQVSED